MSSQVAAGVESRPDGIHLSEGSALTGSQGPSPAPSALQSLCLMARLHHIAAEPVHLVHQLGWPPSHTPSTDDLLLAAKHLA